MYHTSKRHDDDGRPPNQRLRRLVGAMFWLFHRLLRGGDRLARVRHSFAHPPSVVVTTYSTPVTQLLGSARALFHLSRLLAIRFDASRVPWPDHPCKACPCDAFTGRLSRIFPRGT